MKKNLSIIATLIFFVFVTLNAFADPLVKPFPNLNCCEAHCSLGDCHINPGASWCTCGCDGEGNPHCQGSGSINGNTNNNICVNPTQYGNLQRILIVYQNFNSQAGDAAAAIVQSMIDLFSSNNYSLTDNSEGGDVQTYENLLNEIESLQFSQSEWYSINQFLNNCTAGDPCGG